MSQVPFKALRPHRAFQRVVEQIEGSILEGHYSPGDYLPSELQLKEMFKTGRGTVREALRVLEQKGLIEIKPGAGGGPLVKKPEPDKVIESFSLLLRFQRVSFDHLAEFREMLEGRAAALAAKRAGPGHIEKLRALLKKAAAKLAREDWDSRELARLDMEIHLAVAQATGNPVQDAVHRMIHENILERYEAFSMSGRNVFENDFRDLEDLVEAIAAGEAERAEALARNHVRRFNNYFKKGLLTDKTPA